MLAHLTDTLFTIIQNLYISTGLLGIVLAMALESCCIPLPSEIVMPLAGIMIAQGSILKGVSLPLALVLVGLAGAVGCLLGSMAAYGIGYKGGRPLMLKYGRYVLISQHDADKADAFFQRWGSPTAFFSRLLPVVRTYISLPAGIAKMPFVRFCIYTFLGSFPWCIILAYLGTVLGNNLERLSPIFHTFDIVIIVALVILVALYVWRHIRNDRKAREEHALQEAQLMQQSQQNAAMEYSQAAQSQPQWGGVPPQGPAQVWNQPSQAGQNQWDAQPATPSQPGNPPSQSGQFKQPWQATQQPQQNWPSQDDDRTIYRR